MILYDSTVGGVHYQLGTSGFLYRSSKLMYDRKTQSLWSTMLGKPMIGPLVGKGVQLHRLSVVTTSWGAWRRRHPGTRVLDLDTGYERDYGEGVAYGAYFASDELMFDVKPRDKRLGNKAEVLGLAFGGADGSAGLGIEVAFLAKHPIYHGRLGHQRFVVLSDGAGALRVYGTPTPGAADWKLTEWDGSQLALDNHGVRWRLSEGALENEKGQRLKRLPSHRAFWFGWFAAHPKTQLIAG